MKLILSLLLLCLIIFQFPSTTTSKKVSRKRRPSPRLPPPPLPSPPPPTPPPPPLPPPYTNIQLVLSWAPGYCRNPSNNCRKNRNVDFYLHGLWPADASGNSLQNCPHSSLQGKNIVRMVKNPVDRNRLVSRWTTLNQVGSDWDFMAHEWKRHGTCSEITLGQGPVPYLLKGVSATDKTVSLLAAMSTTGVVPGPNSYTAHQIEQAIQAKIGTTNTIYLSCWRDANVYYLYEIYICMDIDADYFIPCPVSKTYRNCPTHRSIELPPM